MLWPPLWGGHLWTYIHYQSFGFEETDEEREALKQWFAALESTLPCIWCKKHWGGFLQIHPLDDEALATKDSVV